MGQQRGYHSVIGTPVFGGLGAVDVSLVRFGKKVAVEVSVNTQFKWEASNISKCLSAGFDHVIVLSSDNLHLANLRKLVNLEYSDNMKKCAGFFYHR